MSTDIVYPQIELALAHKHLREAKKSLNEAQAKQEQAERAQKDAEAAQARAEATAQAERDRADGEEAIVNKLLAPYIDADLPAYVVERIAEALHDDLNHGLAVDQLHEVARGHVNGYLEERP